MAATTLRALVDVGHDVALVVTRPDRRRGRGPQTSPSPVKQVALSLGVPVTDRLEAVAGSGAVLGVVVAYGRIIPAHLLREVPMVNLHFSLLPRWRGAAPVERAILAGDTVTGVCVMAVEEGLDTGGIYASRRVPIEPGETADALRRRLGEEGTALLLDVLESVRSGGAVALPPPVPQQGEPTYAPKVEPDELELAWEQPASFLERVVRLGRSRTTFRGRRLGVVRAQARPAEPSPPPEPPGALVGVEVATGEGRLRLLEVQPEGRRAMDAQAWLRGVRPAPGERLGRPPSGTRLDR